MPNLRHIARLSRVMNSKELSAMSWLRKFKRNDSGVVTADWVVLTAIVAGFAVAGVGLYMPAVNTATDRVAERIDPE